MTFPAIEFWQKKVVHKGDDKFKKKHYYKYYRSKYDICKRYEPEKICEIGVRWGYSAFAFLSACPPQAAYTGYDLIGGGYGGVKINTFGYVKDLLNNHFIKAKISLIHADTRKLKVLGGPYDFIHIDGDHKEAAVCHDMEMAFKSLLPGGIMLIDDYSYIAGVKRAVDSFVCDYGHKITDIEIIESLRGDFLFRKKG